MEKNRVSPSISGRVSLIYFFRSGWLKSKFGEYRMPILLAPQYWRPKLPTNAPNSTPPGKAFHSQLRTQQKAASNNSEIVEKRRQCGYKKFLLGELNGHKEPAGKKEKLSGQNNARHPDDLQPKGWVRASAGDQRHNLRRKYHPDHHKQNQKCSKTA